MSGAFTPVFHQSSNIQTSLVPSAKKQGLVHTDVLPPNCHEYLHDTIFWISVLLFMMKLKYWPVYSALVDSLAL